MRHQGVLSSKYNMSWGFIPAIISLLLGEFIMQDIAIYIGAGVGLLLCTNTWQHKMGFTPHLLLYSTTGILLLLSLTTLFTTKYCPATWYPVTLEICTLIAPLLIYLNRKRFIGYHTSQARQCCKQILTQGAEAVVVSSRVVLMIASLHLFIVLIILLAQHPLGDNTRYILFRIAPASVFILCILFNQIGIHYFNFVMKNTVFIPVVNTKGDVIGKSIASEVIHRKTDAIHPVIRIAVASHGMLFLLPRPQCAVLDKGKTDLLMESYLVYGETLEQGVSRILRQTLPKAPNSDLHFNCMYHFENEITNRLIYLFTLDLDDDSILCNKAFKGGKLWTFQQIEHNLEHSFFSQCFEYEYEQLKSIIDTREKYKEF